MVAEALVNAHMSELTQSSGMTRTKEVDRVIRRWEAVMAFPLSASMFEKGGKL